VAERDLTPGLVGLAETRFKAAWNSVNRALTSFNNFEILKLREILK
jgi:hypothetical protein